MKRRLIFWTVFLLTAGIVVRHLGHGQPIELTRPFSAFPDRLGEWKGRDVRFSSRIEDQLAASDYLYKIFINPAKDTVHLYVGYYSSQRHGEMIHSPKNCLPGNGWYIAEKGTAMVDIPPYRPFRVNQFLVENGIRRELVLYWYQQSGGRVVTNEYLGRAYLVLDAFASNRTDAALIRLNIPLEDSVQESHQQGMEFLRKAYPILMEFLPYADSTRTS